MADVLDAEYDAAIRDLRDRFRSDLVAQWDAGDFAENLLTYLRNRKVPRLFFEPKNLAEIARLAQAYDPEEYAWEKTLADHAVDGRMYGASNAYCDRFIAVDRETFDFSAYEHEDPQTIRGLGRHRWYTSLARAYWEKSERRYFDALMDQWDFYMEKVPFPGEAFYRGMHAMGPSNLHPPFGELDIFIRLTHWWWAYWTILHASEMTPKRNVVLLHRCLLLFDMVAGRGIKIHEHNFTSMQMEAVYFWAMSLPEVTGMSVWKHMARNSMESSLNRAIFADGVHWEKSTGYHCGCIRWYGSSFLLGQMNDEPWADVYGQRLKEMGVFVDALVTPDGNMPLLSDSDRVGTWRNTHALLRCIFPDVRFQHGVSPTYFSLWLSNGQTWEADAGEAIRQITFPEGGVGALRNPDTQSLVILDNGPTHAGHSHEDNLTVHYDALNYPVIVDPGRWVYTGDVARNWVLHCQSHNTVYIEDEPVLPNERILNKAMQVISNASDTRMGKTTGDVQDQIGILQSTFSGYTADAEAEVRRTVLMPVSDDAVWLAVVDEIVSATPHTWTNSWLFPGESEIEVVAGGYRVGLANDICVSFAWCGNTELVMRDDAMFWCPNYAEKSPARWVRLSGLCVSERRAFVFVPTKGNGVMPSVSLLESMLQVVVDGQQWSVSI
jgi:hypothetical protein